MPKVRALPVLSTLTAAGLALNARNLRGRALNLSALTPVTAGTVDTDGWRVIAATGVELHPDTLPAAVAWATEHDMDALDLVPADLPVARALELLGQVDPAKYRSDPLTQGRTAGHALVVREEVAERAGVPTGPVSPAALIDAVRQLKRFAPRSSDLVVAWAERAVDLSPDEQLEAQRTFFDRYGTINLTAFAAQMAVLGAGALTSRRTGLAALAAYELQPALVLRGKPGGLAPRDLARQSATRWVREVGRLAGLLRAEAPRARSLELSDALRPEYAAEIALGTDRFFEAPVDKCRWCGSTELSCLLTTPDLIQHKPGTFRLDECGSCGHVFQNPRLSPEGLDFYYKDCYDGFGGSEMERLFASERSEYEGRAAMVHAVDPSPERWLDVGSGHAHFCLIARDQFPETSFEGLDLGDVIDEAADRGWIDRAYRGQFPDVAPELAGQFDVVSMHHYLEHTREPAEELDAAVTALRPGGLLMIEVPDPESPTGRVLGRYWMPWLQPQHQQFISIGRLEEALVERGFTVLDRYRAKPVPGLDTVAAGWFAAGHVVPRPWMPWRRRPTVADRAARVATLAAAIPATTAAALVAQVSGPKGEDTPGSAFRVLARLDGPTAPITQ
ncbi:class I SAM-dependent methyltransferase [Nocardioides gilvus]|uniref:class I SAM-dependent methyltransferase n=1 Tax=Nocardioides gilvus TaxID=1735589 RepID=UPI000D74D6A1|nr:class I SAM-dependent methyltransferase [Nocardioides gilvus]